MIFDLIRNQEGRAALADIQVAVVNDFRGRWKGIELPWAPAGKVWNLNRRGCHQKAVRRNCGLPANKKARGILEHDVTVGVEISQNLRRVWVVDAIPNQRRR